MDRIDPIRKAHGVRAICVGINAVRGGRTGFRLEQDLDPAVIITLIAQVNVPETVAIRVSASRKLFRIKSAKGRSNYFIIVPYELVKKTANWTLHHQRYR